MSATETVAVILGGGEGRRLQPLTRDRSKPAVPIAGRYRLVDIPISNCINSNIQKMYLLTQFNSVSLHQHIQSTYLFDQFSGGFVRLLAAQQTPGHDSWYQGTADAVRQTMKYLVDAHPKYVLILSGDQLYRMDFKELIRQHEEAGADISIATKPVPRKEAGSLGIMQVDAARRITNFVEKPGLGDALDPLRAPMYDQERYLASMGIYLFNYKVLVELLGNDNKSDFGKHIIPSAIVNQNVHSYIFDGYWKDIGTIGSFWEANLAITDINPEFTFYDATAPVYTYRGYLPPSKINCCDLNRCLLAEGSIISGHRLLHSIIGIRAVIGGGSVIEHSVIMGADYYEPKSSTSEDQPPLGIGHDCFIRNAIIDKNTHIGDGVYISPEGKPNGTVTDKYTVQDGVIVIPKWTVIPSGTRL